MGMPITVPRYTIADLEHFPEDGNRYELLNGMLLVTPAPGVSHQGILSLIQAAVHRGVGEPGYAWVVSPGVVAVPPDTSLKPDLLVFPKRYGLDSKWEWIKERWLAVEVLSRSSKMYDREFKRAAYQAVGVDEVWLVDRHAQHVEVWRAGEEPRVVRDVIHWRPPGLNLVVDVDMAKTFAELA